MVVVFETHILLFLYRERLASMQSHKMLHFSYMCGLNCMNFFSAMYNQYVYNCFTIFFFICASQVSAIMQILTKLYYRSLIIYFFIWYCKKYLFEQLKTGFICVKKLNSLGLKCFESLWLLLWPNSYRYSIYS